MVWHLPVSGRLKVADNARDARLGIDRHNHSGSGRPLYDVSFGACLDVEAPRVRNNGLPGAELPVCVLGG